MGRYYREIEAWQEIKIQRDHLQRLPELAKQGKFFLIFVDYYQSMKFWGLRTELADEEYFSRISIPPNEKRKRATEWRRTGGQVPQPLIGRHLSSEFLYLGYYIFNPPVDSDVDFNEARTNFNQIAARFFPNLLELIIGLRDLPEPIKRLLQTYARSLHEYQSVGN
jgi:hypothetical protein